MQYHKVQSVAKQITTRGKDLDDTILRTMKVIADIVGATLGPGGRQVLLERQEHGLAPKVTKDGVTVYQSLGFPSPAQQAIMEASRDASVRTANEAGDGTTTATVLAEAIVRLTKEFCDRNPRMSPQRVVRRLERAFRDTIEPLLKKLSIKADISTDAGKELLKNVARISANGDTDLAEAVMQCFQLVGDEGNVTIAEVSGPSNYEVERIEGYPIAMGYEESCAKFYPKFINDPGHQRVLMDRVAFVLYHGRIHDVQSLHSLLSKIAYAWQNNEFAHNIVLVATGFSEQVLGYLGMMFAAEGALNVFPLLVPQTPFPNGQLDFLLDLAAVTGAEVFDPLNKPLDSALVIPTEEQQSLGKRGDLGRAEVFEANRFRSNVVGEADEDCVMLRVDELKTQLARAESQLDAMNLQERLGKLTGGIARLKVIGVSNGELKEKRDRAEDAVCAVRGAIKHGCLPGGGWGLLRVMEELKLLKDPILDAVLVPALLQPVQRLLENAGFSSAPVADPRKHWFKRWFSKPSPMLVQVQRKPTVDERGWTSLSDFFRLPDVRGMTETELKIAPLLLALNHPEPVVYDVLEERYVVAIEGGILDSTPAVLEAIRNSISIAALLGTLGGTVVFARDPELERQEARHRAEWEESANRNEANERP